MNIDFGAFLQSLSIMAYGMGGIFIVTAVIYLCIFLLVKFTTKK